MNEKQWNNVIISVSLFLSRVTFAKRCIISLKNNKFGCGSSTGSEWQNPLLKANLNIEKGWRKCHMIWRRVSKSCKSWLKCFTVCVANDLKHWMTETNFDRRKSKTSLFSLVFLTKKSDKRFLDTSKWHIECDSETSSEWQNS